ncbi:ARM repeat-containing protein [Auricularia subglabra TFB-10046 SS5]|uniref:ARM repeat-containing protein n=1 Tax=Auricularia subglabra (strain TFB-10046 / SS5) TaxID=717982 RepID=J0WUD4_AURST|nr:ARM repeat-containing protein [Auricularia subglabra TFB-10046 SS5]
MSTTAPKPSLQGVRIRARKGAVKAQAKHEPAQFRDQVLKHLDTVPPGDYDALFTRLVSAGSSLEFLKYADELYEILIIGGLLQPGGAFVDDGAPICSFALVQAPNEAEVKKYVDVLNRLIRRYKYLQKPLEESSIPTLLQYVQKWTPEQRDRLAYATGLMMATGLTGAGVLQSLTKEHLIKDDVSLNLLTRIIRAYLSEQNVDHLATTLRKGGIKDLTLFFPPNKRTATHLQDHFKENGMPQVAEWWAKRQTVGARQELISKLKEMYENDEAPEAIIETVKAWQTEHPGALADTDALISSIWQAMMASVDWSGARPDQIEALALREVKKFAPVLEPFCTTAKTQVALVNVVQLYCYEDRRIMKAFPQILKVLYNTDCISDQAIIYWYQKGAKPQGKQHFLAATEPLVKYLEAQESDDDDEE